MTEIVLAGAVRTPVGSFNGALSSVPAHVLGQTVIGEALKRAKVDAREVSEVIMGQILTAGEGQNPARQAAIGAGIPNEATAYTINQVCGSGLRSVALGYQARCIQWLPHGYGRRERGAAIPDHARGTGPVRSSVAGPRWGGAESWAVQG